MDSGIESGDEITQFYDPMIAKLIVYGEDRPADGGVADPIYGGSDARAISDDQVVDDGPVHVVRDRDAASLCTTPADRRDDDVTCPPRSATA